MKISQIADRLALDIGDRVTIDHLRYLEKKGVIEPNRIDGNDYRDFNDKHYSFLVKALRMERIGISLDDIKRVLINRDKGSINYVMGKLDVISDDCEFLAEVL